MKYKYEQEKYTQYDNFFSEKFKEFNKDLSYDESILKLVPLAIKKVEENPEDTLIILASISFIDPRNLKHFRKQIKNDEAAFLWNRQKKTYADTKEIADFLNSINHLKIVNMFTEELTFKTKHADKDDFDRIFEETFQSFPQPYYEYKEKQRAKRFTDRLNKNMENVNPELIDDEKNDDNDRGIILKI